MRLTEAAAGSRPPIDADGLGDSVRFRCTAPEKAALVEHARSAGVSVSTLMRIALGLAVERRRRPRPKADPLLLREIGRIGATVGQIARDTAQGSMSSIDAIDIAARLLAVDRGLQRLLKQELVSHGDRPPSC